MGRFARTIKDAAAAGNGGGSWLPCLNAKYRVKIREVKAIDRFKGGMSFIVEFEVLELLIAPKEDKDAAGVAVPPVGMTRSQVTNLVPGEGWRSRSMIEFLEVASGEDMPEDEDEQEAVIELAVGKEQPFAEMIMDVVTTPTKTTGPAAKAEFWTKHEWSVVQ